MLEITAWVDDYSNEERYNILQAILDHAPEFKLITVTTESAREKQAEHPKLSIELCKTPAALLPNISLIPIASTLSRIKLLSLILSLVKEVALPENIQRAANSSARSGERDFAYEPANPINYYNLMTQENEAVLLEDTRIYRAGLSAPRWEEIDGHNDLI
ncbi:uncharacterized protein K444DRAFT_638515 [Hyaloscypha bicolor E]|uniref:Uncharacterized protein n=1 Tax=Hyaloscypha bicolor E TaxID=1095630 RepID=A0A2J6SGN4_9HELO|nr:uncharacterized protein K444DRAFT_638515 [Hyaloscypha bicolor E]PMD49936.1 hypothetical protein K444DRAFT_638515 [Hyaloscypha bicolor E]